jgi:hypothetical protein
MKLLTITQNVITSLETTYPGIKFQTRAWNYIHSMTQFVIPSHKTTYVVQTMNQNTCMQVNSILQSANWVQCYKCCLSRNTRCGWTLRSCWASRASRWCRCGRSVRSRLWPIRARCRWRAARVNYCRTLSWTHLPIILYFITKYGLKWELKTY